MKYFLAKNDRELGLCLRMIYPETTEVKVESVLNEKKKMEFRIIVDMDDETFNRYQQRYDTFKA